MPESFEELSERYRAFNAARDWSQFHDPKSLILALVGEVGELAELFQWVPAELAARAFREPQRQQRAAEEMADILIYLLGLADSLSIDLVASAHSKLTEAETRFPADRVRGVAPFKA